MQAPRPCPDLLNQHLWGWHPGIGLVDRLPKDFEIEPGLNFEWVIHVG